MKFSLTRECKTRLKKLDERQIQDIARHLKIKESLKNLKNAILTKFAQQYLVLGYRHSLKNMIRHELDKITEDSKYACVWGKKKILNVVELGKRLGMGAFGAVDGGLVKISKLKRKENIVLKYLAIDEDIYERINNGFEDLFPVNREILTHYYTNKLLDQKICPNLIYMWDWWICENCKGIQTKKGGETTTMPDTECFIAALEHFDGDARGLTSDKKNKKNIFDISFVFQVFYALACLQKYYGIDHNDAGFRNILYKKIPAEMNDIPTYWTYIIYSKEYYIPNNGYLFALSDYGLARSERIFGTRSDFNVVDAENRVTRILENQKIKYGSDNDLDVNEIKQILSNPDNFHTRDRGVAILAREMTLYKLKSKIALKAIKEVADQLPKDVLKSKVRKVQPAINYVTIFERLFEEYTVKPDNGICIGVYSADKKLKKGYSSLDREYKKYLEQFYE